MFQGKTKKGAQLDQLDGFEHKRQNRCWLVVGDRSKLRIFEQQKNLEGETELLPVTEIVSEGGRLKDHELGSDRPGRSFQSHTVARHSQSGGLRHALSSRQTPHDHQTDLLIERSVEFLDAARKQSRFDSIRLFADPHFIGLMKEAIGNTNLPDITEFVEKDYSRLSGSKLKQRLEHAVVGRIMNARTR